MLIGKQIRAVFLSLLSVKSVVVPDTSSSIMPARKSVNPARETEQIPPPLLWFYKVRPFNSKDAFLVLLWGFSGFYVYNQLIYKKISIGPDYISAGFIVNAGMLVYPFLGWLADVRYGRYSVIKYSLLAIWLVSVIFCMVSVVLKLLIAYGVTSDTVIYMIELVVIIVLYVTMTIGLGGFQANIVQFGIDQLIDASSGEITSFIRWYIWMFVLSHFLVPLTQTCLCQGYEIIYMLVIPALLSIMLCLDYFCADRLVKEPVFKNPLAEIFQVLKYAAKNKYPRLRSAFTYWDDKHCSRINLAKIKYGGPFTTEQVDDVKTFWRIVLIICIAAFFVSIIVYINEAKDNLKYHLRNDYHDEGCNKNCFWRIFVFTSGDVFVIVFIPLFECYLSFKKHFKLSILQKLAIGMFFILLTMCGFGILEAVGHYQNQSNIYINTTCVLDITSYQLDSVLSLSYTWLLIPNIMYGIGTYLLLIAVTEFLCAQSPYSMKGLLFGLLYGIGGVFVVLDLAWLLPVQYAVKKWSSSTQVGCGTFFFFSIFGILFIVTLFFCCACKCYKKRQRDEDEHSEEIFFVDY